MKSVSTIVLVAVVCVLFISACDKKTSQNHKDTSIKSFADYLGKPIATNLQGTIINHDQEPLDSTKISIGNTYTYTDSKGQFRIENAKGHDGLLSFSIEKEGYKNEQISISPKDSSSTVNITLYKTSHLNLARFSKTNYNLPPFVEELP